MANKVIFDGPTKTITIKSLDDFGDPVTEIDVQTDLYMGHMDWVRDEEGHGYLPAFRSSGREPTNEAGTQFTPAYFFLLNGWSIIANSGRNISIQTNLYPDPDGTTTTASMFVISNNTQVTNERSQAPVVSSELEKALIYGGRIYINSHAPESGQAYPYGTTAQPVNNMADAITVAEQYGIQEFHAVGTINIVDDYDTFTVTGGAGETLINFDGNTTIHDAVFKKCTINGDLNGSYDNIFTGCHLNDNLENLSGRIFFTGLKGSVKIKENDDVLFIDCYSEISGSNAPTLIMPDSATSNNNVSFRGYKGGLNVQGFKGTYDQVLNTGMIATISYLAGKCNIDNTNTGGFISIRNIPINTVTDESVGSVIDTDACLTSQKTMSDALELIRYSDQVVFDINGEQGTDFPIGTTEKPVNNLSDALLIMDKINTRKMFLYSDITIDQDIPNLHIEGIGGKEIVTVVDVNIDNCFFHNCYIVGQAQVGSRFRADQCALGPVDNLLNVSGSFNNCGITGNITMWGPYPSIFTQCFAKKLAVTDPYPSVFIGDGVDTANVHNIGFRGFNGHIKFGNSKNATNDITLDMGSGFVTIDNTNTAGNFRITGLAENGYENLSSLTLDVSNLSPSAEVLNEKIERDNYNGKIIIDIDNGIGLNGDPVEEHYPIGTFQYPVNNLLDARSIADYLGINNFEVLSDITMSLSMNSGYIFEGKTGGETLTFIGATYPQSTFRNFYIQGDLGGTLTRFDNCRMIGVTNFEGSLWNCIILDDITIKSGTSFLMRNCFSASFEEVTGMTDTPKIIMGALGDGLKIVGNIRGWHGPIQVSHMDNASKSLTAHVDSGYMIIDNTNTDGWLYIQGFLNNSIDNQSSGNLSINEEELHVRTDEFSQKKSKAKATLSI